MNRSFFLILSTTILAFSIGSVAVHAADSNTSATSFMAAQGQDSTTPSVLMNSQAKASAHHVLTRRDVYNQLVQEEKDGTLARIDALYFGS